ncbi:DUF3054 domain-containing protein [Corynebacterium flavescens]|uniref:Membrane protein n=1 Tax=Corynebacterium flavescens TaxID=28028 RepID=A0A1L7CPI0_CORFL|nr:MULTISPECIES: DUF3054 domain-containing protein [Corynebacterium]APT87754.1 membrane protein [Corynebacterium flavescens]KAA8720141.1 DUF3054 domain-containing protein [Corynebacterium flavescens]MDN6099766.1 DUF3054 domain-containing protein [Corynebacterium flavescens]MDN6199321.1 DUF3054 domain-containing protein [Corynebacterium flavescens]MDN6225535.1 DUF3054 domain-containing protein [Corynebacterium flavescens]
MRIAPVIDILALVIFAIAARLAHGGLSLTSFIDAFWPWTVGALLGWVIILLLPPRGKWAEGIIVWVSAIIGGMALWVLVNGRLPHWSFLIVATTMSALFLFGWRAFDRKKPAAAAL